MLILKKDRDNFGNTTGRYNFLDPDLSGEVRRFRINSYDETSSFADGEGEWGLVNYQGAEIVRGFDKINPFKEHLALTKKGEKYGYLNDTGRIAIDFIYDEASNFKNGVAKVEQSGESFYINYLGEKVENVSFNKESRIWHKKGNSLVSVFNFEKDESIKFTTKIAADDSKEQIAKFFYYCSVVFWDLVPRSSFKKEFEEFGDGNVLVLEIPPNLKMLEVNIRELIKILTDAKKSRLLDVNLENAGPLIESVGKLDGENLQALKRLIKSLKMPEGDFVVGAGGAFEDIFTSKTLWVFDGTQLLTGDGQLDDSISKSILENFYPKEAKEYSLLRLKEAMVIKKGN